MTVETIDLHDVERRLERLIDTRAAEVRRLGRELADVRADVSRLDNR